MSNFSTYYSILNINENATKEEIKAAFRKLSLIHHPDKNNNSIESNTKFIILLNAYNVLINEQNRNEYNNYLKSSKIVKNWEKNNRNIKSVLPGKKGEKYKSNEELLAFLNYILWEIEDYLQNKNEEYLNIKCNNKTIRQYILIILTFIDKWILEMAGFKDYFMQARGKNSIDPREYINIIGKRNGYNPYANILDYFYEIRKRMDKFIKRMGINILFEKISDINIRLIDCIIEAQNLSIHYLSYLMKIEEGKIENIPEYEYSQPLFKD